MLVCQRVSSFFLHYNLPYYRSVLEHSTRTSLSEGSLSSRRAQCWCSTWKACQGVFLLLPSGKPLHNYGKSPLIMGQLTISTGTFSIVMFDHQRVLDRMRWLRKYWTYSGAIQGWLATWVWKSLGIRPHFQNHIYIWKFIHIWMKHISCLYPYILIHM